MNNFDRIDHLEPKMKSSGDGLSIKYIDISGGDPVERIDLIIDTINAELNDILANDKRIYFLPEDIFYYLDTIKTNLKCIKHSLLKEDQ